jgi:hypothetical protein
VTGEVVFHRLAAAEARSAEACMPAEAQQRLEDFARRSWLPPIGLPRESAGTN